MKNKININWDALGIATSVACAIHCALLPLLLTSLPLFGINIIHNNFFEWGMITLAFFIGGYSLYHGFRRHHHQVKPLLLFCFGFLFLILKQFFHHYELIFLLLAVAGIIVAHFLNFRYCRLANRCHSTDCNH